MDEQQGQATTHHDPYRRQLANFAAAIEGDAEPLLGRADAAGRASVLDALLRSAA